tara:strand:- start:8461 stop:9426 length:966 start_codon:yes stop_codon:yes gene_type:complete
MIILNKIFRELEKIYRLPFISNIKEIFFIVCIAFFIFSFYNNFSEINLIQYRIISTKFILVIITFNILSLFMNGLAWKELIKWTGNNIKGNQLVYLFVSTNILKYVPGGIWHFIERFNYLKRFIGYKQSLVSILLEPILMISSALFFIPFGYNSLILYVLLLAPSLLFNSNLIVKLIKILENIKIKTLKSLRIKQIETNEIKEILIRNHFPYKAWIYESLFVVFKFLSFWLCLVIFELDNQMDFLNCLSIFSLSWTIGLLVPSAPGGVGVFESIFLFLSNNTSIEPLLIATLIIYRLQMVGCELIIGLPFAFKNYIRRNNN